jgi:tRNA U55 pseudouridine synthase TruB
LGVGAALEMLERTSSDPYLLSDALSFNELAQEVLAPTDRWNKAFIPIHSALSRWPTYTVRGKDERLIHNGQISYDLERRLIVEAKASIRQQEKIGIKLISAESGLLLAILEAQPNQGPKVRRVFKMS